MRKSFVWKESVRHGCKNKMTKKKKNRKKETRNDKIETARGQHVRVLSACMSNATTLYLPFFFIYFFSLSH